MVLGESHPVSSNLSGTEISIAASLNGCCFTGQATHKKVSGAKQFCRKGLEHYEAVGEIFDTTTATGQMRFSSNHILSESDDEHELEDRYHNTGIHIDMEEDEDMMFRYEGNDERGKRKRQQVSSSSERCPKQWEAMENYMKVSCHVMKERLVLAKQRNVNSIVIREKNAEIARLKEKIEDLMRELDKSTKMTRDRDPTVESVHRGGKYTLEECLEILDEMNVEPSKFVKIMDRFLDPKFRHFFVIMGDAKRKAWLDSLN